MLEYYSSVWGRCLAVNASFDQIGLKRKNKQVTLRYFLSLLTSDSRKKIILKDRNIIWTIEIASKSVTSQYAFHTYRTSDMNFLAIFRRAFVFFIRIFRPPTNRITKKLKRIFICKYCTQVSPKVVRVTF